MDIYHKYRVFGLNIQSQIQLPELTVATFDLPDVRINIGINPEHLKNPLDTGILFEANKNDILFKIDSAGSYRIENGNSITLDPAKHSSDDTVRLFLLGSAFAALLHQRDMLPQHSSSVMKNGKAILIGGISGAGKSSLAATLLKRDYELLADDISILEVIDNTPFIKRGITHLKLWEDVLQSLDLNREQTKRIRPEIQKFRKEIKVDSSKELFPVAAIIILTTKNTPGFEIVEKKGAEKLALLKINTFRNQFIKGLNKSSWQFRELGRLANASRVFQISRPLSPLQLEELADFLEEKLHSFSIDLH